MAKNELSKLKWRCRQGVKELDILLTHYLEHKYERASIEEQQTFQTLLELSNVDLYAYLVKNEISKNREIQILVEKIRQL